MCLYNFIYNIDDSSIITICLLCHTLEKSSYVLKEQFPRSFADCNHYQTKN